MIIIIIITTKQQSGEARHLDVLDLVGGAQLRLGVAEGRDIRHEAVPRGAQRGVALIAEAGLRQDALVVSDERIRRKLLVGARPRVRRIKRAGVVEAVALDLLFAPRSATQSPKGGRIISEIAS